jgi:hypothetical protein
VQKFGFPNRSVDQCFAACRVRFAAVRRTDRGCQIRARDRGPPGRCGGASLAAEVTQLSERMDHGQISVSDSRHDAPGPRDRRLAVRAGLEGESANRSMPSRASCRRMWSTGSRRPFASAGRVVDCSRHLAMA